MKTFHKVLFFFFVVVLAFIPGGFIVSFILLLIYYGTPILDSMLKETVQEKFVQKELRDAISQLKELTQNQNEMNSYADDTLEKMK